MSDLWDRVVGQDRAVASLRRAAERPAHAYLLVGPRGSGIEEAARAFAAALIGAEGDDRVTRRVHPDVVEFEPTANTYSVIGDVRERIIPEVHRAPIEGERKVVVLLDAERLNEPSANALLKTLEEPPARTVVMLLTASPDELLETVRSRCQRVDLAALDAATLRAALERDGVDRERAETLAALAGGQLARARALAGRLARLRDTFVCGPARLDGTGAAVALVADELGAAVQDAVAELRAQHEAEAAELDAELERAGYPDRAAQALRKRLTDRQKREARRARTDALLEGFAALESVYRDALATPAPPLNRDRVPLELTPRACAEALDALREARDAMEFNPSEALLLDRLLLHLPAAPEAARR